MRLEKLEIRQLPGIDAPFTLEDVSPQVNLVTGPNAVGKSSLIRALRLLFGEKAADSGAISLSAVFRSRDASWTVHRNGSELVWEKDGVRAEKPYLPELNQLSAYWLSLEDLLQADQPQEELVAELRRELSGGYDVLALREDASFSIGKLHGKAEEKKLLSARKGQQKIVADYESLLKEEKSLPALKKKIDAARESREHARSIEDALSLLELREKVSDIETDLHRFPSHMDSLHGDEQEQLSGLSENRADLLKRLELAKNTLEVAQQELLQSRLPDIQPVNKDMESSRLKLEDARVFSGKIQDRQEALAKSKATKNLAQVDLGDESGIPHLDPASVSRAEALANTIHIAEQRLQLLEDELDECAGPPDPIEVDDNHQAGLALRNWLASSDGSPVGMKWAVTVAFVVCTVMMVMAALSRIWPLFWAECVAFVALVWVLIESHFDRRKEHRQAFEKLAVNGPEDWNASGVETCLRNIDKRMAELQILESQSEVAEKLIRRRDKKRRQLGLFEEQRATLAEELGFNPKLTATAFSNFIMLAGDYRKASTEIEALENLLEQLEADYAERIGSVHDFLAEWGSAPEPDYLIQDLQGCLDDLRERRESALNAVSESKGAEKEIRDIETRVEDLDSSIAKIFSRVQIELGDTQELSRRLEQIDSWKKLQSEYEKSVIRRDDNQLAVENSEGLIDRVNSGDEEGLRKEWEETRELALELDSLRDKHTEIRTRLKEAGANQLLEQASAEVDRAIYSLQEKFDQAKFADIGNMLLDAANEEYQNVHEPGVLKYARALFQKFTKHQFDMEFDGKTNRFKARDLAQGRLFQISELSSATRMQLLLATRIARARQMEGAETFPLFLDESLTTSDEQRFGLVAQSLEKIAGEEGRQVFYLGARHHEADLWEQMTQNRPHHIDLARVRFGAGEAGSSDFQLRGSEPLPSPGQHSPQSYAALLEVWPVNPRRSAGRIHLFHLLRDDLKLLHGLMQDWLIISLGPLEAALRGPAAVNISPHSAVRERLDARCAIARSWVGFWRQGRGKPVERSVLENATVNGGGIISDKFIDEVSDLADSLQGDAESLVAALEEKKVGGFLTRKTEELRRYFEDEDYIDQQKRLTMEEREQKILILHSGIAKPKEIRQIVHFLESGLQQS